MKRALVGPALILCCVVGLSGCSVTSRDALPEEAENMVCVRGHDEADTPDTTGPEFVCDEWVRETP